VHIHAWPSKARSPCHAKLQMHKASASLLNGSSAVAQDEERLKKAVNQVPTNEELNAMLARSENELQLFNRLDQELEWPDEQGMH